MNMNNNRKGFEKNDIAPILREESEKVLPHSSCIVYGVTKLSHSGVSTWKVFEGYSRKMKKESLSNLITTKKDVDGQLLVPENLKVTRSLNAAQSRKVKSYASKLCYYSKVRSFTSKKSGKYSFKVAFLTLTAPESCSNAQFLRAFEHFIHYLTRTARAEYVWKKELGSENSKFHVHILLNNFIPYYLVSWKWKRLLIAQDVVFEKKANGKDTSAHTRIELPRSKKLVSYYIAKYLSKAYSIPRELGYVAGHSEGLEKCKEELFIEGDLNKDELLLLQNTFRTIKDQFITHVCVDLRVLKDCVPDIFSNFDRQFKKFQELITHEQRYLTI